MKFQGHWPSNSFLKGMGMQSPEQLLYMANFMLQVHEQVEWRMEDKFENPEMYPRCNITSWETMIFFLSQMNRTSAKGSNTGWRKKSCKYKTCFM